MSSFFIEILEFSVKHIAGAPLAFGSFSLGVSQIQSSLNSFATQSHSYNPKASKIFEVFVGTETT
jgi:hypothetical protein